ncbi:MAG TPA: lysylphosphatidylglycerol synthase domain-containing protein [Kofleriaceae bacterium]|nr:lysylphosphatidylglycerol synthase domain-containing protein [Kofleriaceae bacterium]
MTDDVAPAPGTSERPALKWVRRLAPWVISGSVVTAILVKYPVGRIFDEMQRGNALGMVPVALGTTLLIWFTATTGDYVLLGRMASRPVGYRFLLRSKAGMSMLNALGMALNYGGFALWIHRVLGCGWRRSGGAVLMITLGDLTAVSFIATAAVFVGGDGLPAQTRAQLEVIAPIVAVVAALFLFVPRPSATRRAVFEPWARVPRVNRLASVVSRGGTIAFLILATWLAARAFGLPVPFKAWASFLPVLLVIGALPVNVGGLGPVQAAWLLLFGPWATGPQILAFQFLWHLCLVVGLFLRGAPFIRSVIADIAKGQGVLGGQAGAPATSATPSTSTT